VLGIDIGGTKTAAGLVAPDGSVLQAGAVPTPASQGAQAILQAAAGLAESLLLDGLPAGGQVRAAGVGAPGLIEYPGGRVLFAGQHVPGWGGTEVGAYLARRLGMPVVVDNDVNALGLGEARFGAGRGLAHILFVAAGTGIGGAILLNGNLWRGCTFSAGEFGHLLVDWSGGRMCNCGLPGHLEAYAAGPAIAARYCELAGETGALDLKEVARRAAQADVHARQAIAEGGAILGKTLAGLLNAIDPQALIIGGGVTALGETWWQAVLAAIRANPLPGPARVQVAPARLGAQAGLVGAAALAYAGLEEAA
jgi:glucokinase